MIYRITSIQYIYNKRCKIEFLYLNKNKKACYGYIVCNYNCTLLYLKNMIEHKILRSYYGL